MDIHSKPINERIEWLLDLARRHSASFTSPEMFLARERYLAEHPSDIVVLKCMDGRINIPVATNTPPGILTPIRNLGGMLIWAGRISVKCLPIMFMAWFRPGAGCWS
ncbi:MAG: hypothetical protein WC392_08420 [Sulfuricella sp.]|jgi:carbonic anhydrase